MIHTREFTYTIKGKTNRRWLHYGYDKLTDKYIVAYGWQDEESAYYKPTAIKLYVKAGKCYHRVLYKAQREYFDRFNHFNELGVVNSKEFSHLIKRGY